MPRYRANTMPLPVPTPVSEPFWQAAREHRLAIQRCPGGHVFAYARSHCPVCLAAGHEWVDASGRATLYSYTVARRPTSPDFEGETPYVIAIIALEEGPHIMSRLVEIEPEDVRIGMSLEVVFDDVTPEVSLPYFRPAQV